VDDDDAPEPRPAPIGVRVVPLERRRTSRPLRIEGRIAASRAVQIKALTAGVVRDLDAQLGSQMAEGDRICTVGADAHEQRVLACEAQLLLLEAQLEERRDVLAQARARPEPADRIASLESKVRAAEHRVAQERVNQRRHALAAQVVDLRAPFGARVAAVSAARGASVAAGQPLVELVEIDPAILVLEVPTWVAARCREGTEVVVHADSDEAPRKGRVSRWAPTAADGVRRLLVEVPNADGAIAAGEGAVAELDVGARDAFFAPRAALVAADKAVCLQLVEHSVARIQRVRVLGGDEDEVEVAGKLSASQLVVLYAERRLEESSEVVIRGDH
jgi:RND family efflux transporter MFP subunit